MDLTEKTSVTDTLLTCVGDGVGNSIHGIKVTIVGAGQVGLAAAFAIINQDLVGELVLIDSAKDKLAGEVMDLQHGIPFLKNVKVSGSTEYSASAGSRICVITAGARQREGEGRLDLVQRNTDILKAVIPQLVEFSPHTIILLVSNPVDILTFVAWKLSGLPKTRIIGSGTNLDSARFRVMMSERLRISPTSCHGWIIGEHGDSSVPVWSGINVAGVRLRDLHPGLGKDEDHEGWTEIHRRVVDSAYEIIKLKGYTSWAVGLSVASIVQAILHDTRSVHAVSTLVQGFHGIQDEVFLSLPAVLGSSGVTHVVNQTLTDDEILRLQHSAETLHAVQVKINL